MMNTIFNVTNSNGDDFNVRIVRKGDRYGLNGCSVHNETEALVEVYDAEYPHTEFGQFVSRYYISTLINGKSRNTGINLEGSAPKWRIDAHNWSKVIAWLEVK